jgi:NAD dependent epimerase/dehydratase family enzyme
MKLPWNLKHAPLIAFAVIALGGGLALQANSDDTAENLYDSQIQACERVNKLREESNQRVLGLRTVRNSLEDFLRTAAEARFDAYQKSGNDFDRKAYVRWEKTANELVAKVRFGKVPIVDCEKVIERP